MIARIEEKLESETESALTEDSRMSGAKLGPVMATPAAFAGAAGYAWITLQAYDLGREHAGANG
ncbi:MULTISPECIES: hypothetical protein [Nesterenkonia]|uniref:Uncharacterized protein n=1 Tax=Nesterenkonia xinjiangensis TaxID=225327 RepID=A0A7Z0K8T0_9MICC|nr:MULTISPECIES: hypothetical protein [Nesterenkonia]MDZ5077367.1 hypothetical protein [Nesterenkonia sp. HG001]NYJ77989.1 hypothetical protein [Nesterenkonia xinjiangensis]